MARLSARLHGRSRLAAALLAGVVLSLGVGWSVVDPEDQPLGVESATGSLPLSDAFDESVATLGSPPAMGTTTTRVSEDVTPTIPPGGSLVATARPGLSDVPIWAVPDTSTEPAWRLSPQTEFWGERHFLVLEDAGDWLRVSVPVRPNGSVGWIPRDTVRLSVSEFVVRVVLSEPALQIWRDDEMVFESTPAIGNDRAPTPLGRWYIRDVFAWDEASVYGPWVLALSAYSEHIEQINGADAVVAIHGTNRPDLLGRAVSLGCIRLRNDDVTLLAQTVPVGTPVEIVA